MADVSEKERQIEKKDDIKRRKIRSQLIKRTQRKKKENENDVKN